MVYIISCNMPDGTMRTKIGKTLKLDYQNLERRMDNIATGSACPVEYNFLFPTESDRLERELHRLFSDQRVRYITKTGRKRTTEWFNIVPGDVLDQLAVRKINSNSNWIELECV